MSLLMSREDWRSAEPLVDQLLDLAPDERAAFLDQLRREKPGRCAEIEAMVAECELSDSLLEAPAADRFAALLGDDVAPALLGSRYRIDREVGHGAMATVYLAEDTQLGRQVAVKVLDSHVSAAVFRQRFLAEIRTVSTLRHPSIVEIHDAGETEGYLYYVMPYIKGETLRAHLARKKQLSIDEAVRITKQVAAGLSHAHSRGVIHRDVKPENILLDDDRALIGDFGIAQAMHAAAGDRFTGTGVIVGTAAYMSPEQSAGVRELDARCDVYALAVVTFEMLAGERPFDGPTPQALAAKHQHAPVPELRLVRPTIGPSTQRVLERGLAKVAADRFTSPVDFADALEQSIAEGAVALRRARQRRAWLTVGAFVALALVGILAWRARGAVFAGSRPGTVAGTIPRIAILYLDDRTPDSALRHIADGLTEDLIHEMSGVNAFQVISSYGVRPYRGRAVPFDSMVSALRADKVVAGSVQQVGDAVRVMVQLIDAKSDTYVDSISLQQPLKDLLSLERELAQRVAGALRKRLGAEVRLRGITSGTSNVVARELMLKAERVRGDADELVREAHPEDIRAGLAGLARADSLLAAAASADPSWARPVVDRGWVATQRSALEGGQTRVKWLEQALGIAENAVHRWPASIDALELRGTVLWKLAAELEVARPDSQRLARAENDLRQVLDRDSTLARTWATLSFLLQTKGSLAEAAMAARTALREDPYLINAREVLNELFFSTLMLGDFAQAHEWCRRGRVAFPGDWRFVECELTWLRHNVTRRPDADSAWQLVGELDRLDPPASAASAGRTYHAIYRRVVAATLSARAGHPEIARAEIARARRLTAADPSLRLDLAYDEAYLRLVLGERERAIQLLQQLLAVRPVLRSYITRDPLFRELALRDSTPTSRQ